MPKLLTKKDEKRLNIKRKPKAAPAAAPVKPKPDPVESLVVTVADLVKTTSETNSKAVALMDKIAIRVGTETSQVPSIIMPEGAKKWRFKVVARDGRGFLETVDAERIE